MAWGKGVTTTLTGTTSTITSDTIVTPKQFNTVLIHEFVGTAGDYQTNTFNADTGSLYADRYSRNGGADSTQTSQAKMLISSSYEESQSFTVMQSCWISGNEKLIMSHQVGYTTAGAGTAPNRYEVANKYVPSTLTDTFDTIEIDSANTTATFLIDSNVSVLSSDLTPAAAVPFVPNAQVGSRAEITDTRKIYYRDEISFKELDGNEATNYRSDSWYEQLSGETP